MHIEETANSGNSVHLSKILLALLIIRGQYFQIWCRSDKKSRHCRIHAAPHSAISEYYGHIDTRQVNLESFQCDALLYADNHEC